MSGTGRLSRRLAVLISTGFALFWLLAVLAMALVLHTEQDELLNLELRETARLVLPALSREAADRDAPGLILPGGDGPLQADEALIFLLVNRTGDILLRTPSATGVTLPQGPVAAGYVITDSHVFYTTDFNRAGHAVRYGDPRRERRKAYRESLLAFLLPMLAIVPLSYLMVGWIARITLRPLERLRDDIAQRAAGRLDPIDPAHLPAELREITVTLNGFMIRLAQSLESERAFASNAAHELRTPIAVALAQVQLMRGSADADPDMAPLLDRVEAALKRMGRLVGRLMQLARAEAGVGPGDSAQDLVPLLGHVVEEISRDPARAARLQVTRAQTPVWSQIDPDAFAIIAGNLIDNAFQHGSADCAVSVTLEPGGLLRVANPGPLIAPDNLARITRRFQRQQNRAEGLGLGLYISDRLAQQCGGSLSFVSPAPGHSGGLEARFQVPLAPGKT